MSHATYILINPHSWWIELCFILWLFVATFFKERLKPISNSIESNQAYQAVPRTSQRRPHCQSYHVPLKTTQKYNWKGTPTYIKWILAPCVCRIDDRRKWSTNQIQKPRQYQRRNRSTVEMVELPVSSLALCGIHKISRFLARASRRCRMCVRRLWTNNVSEHIKTMGKVAWRRTCYRSLGNNSCLWKKCGAEGVLYLASGTGAVQPEDQLLIRIFSSPVYAKIVSYNSGGHYHPELSSKPRADKAIYWFLARLLSTHHSPELAYKAYIQSLSQFYSGLKTVVYVYLIHCTERQHKRIFATVASITPGQQNSAKQLGADHQAKITCYASDRGTGSPKHSLEVTQTNGQPGQVTTTARSPKGMY